MTKERSAELLLICALTTKILCARERHIRSYTAQQVNDFTPCESMLTSLESMIPQEDRLLLHKSYTQ